ncbi:MAG: 50S ribosomal protein L24e [Thermoplasmata archaeon]
MVERRVCTFCGVEIEPGTGRMYVRKDGVTYNFCSSKCYKNLVELGRVPRRVTWTRYYEREKQVRLKTGPAKASVKKRKVKKAEKVAEPKEAEAEAKAEAKPSDAGPGTEAPKEEKPAPKKAKAPEKDEVE